MHVRIRDGLDLGPKLNRDSFHQLLQNEILDHRRSVADALWNCIEGLQWLSLRISDRCIFRGITAVRLSLSDLRVHEFLYCSEMAPKLEGKEPHFDYSVVYQLL